MKLLACLALLPVILCSGGIAAAAGDEPKSPPTMSEVLANSKATDWEPLDPEETLYLELPGGRVVLSLAPEFAPRHVANIQTLARAKYYDGLAVVRSQDNYVVQWGDPAEDPSDRRPLTGAQAKLAPEFDRDVDPEQVVTLLPEGDVYAPQAGFSLGLPVAVDPENERMWLVHCYGMVGVGRDVAVDSGNGAELYVVIGHSPRHLDRNVTLVGRVVQGMEILSTLPRGTGPLGFYEDPGEYVPIRSMRLASTVPEAERVDLEVLRTDTDTFGALVASRRYRRESWFAQPTGRIEVCNVPLPVRARPGR